MSGIIGGPAKHTRTIHCPQDHGQIEQGLEQIQKVNLYYLQWGAMAAKVFCMDIEWTNFQ